MIIVQPDIKGISCQENCGLTIQLGLHRRRHLPCSAVWIHLDDPNTNANSVSLTPVLRFCHETTSRMVFYSAVSFCL